MREGRRVKNETKNVDEEKGGKRREREGREGREREGRERKGNHRE